jgi:hypothetical protein
VLGILIGCVGGPIGGGLFAVLGAVFVFIGVGVCVHTFATAGDYEAAEAAYRKRRAVALAHDKDAETGQVGVTAPDCPEPRPR